MTSKGIKTLIITIVAVVLAIVLYSTCTARVSTGYTGILTTFGKVENYTLDAGFHLKSPFQVVTVMDNREQKTSLVLVTHDRRLARQLDRVLELHEGKLREVPIDEV